MESGPRTIPIIISTTYVGMHFLLKNGCKETETRRHGVQFSLVYSDTLWAQFVIGRYASHTDSRGLIPFDVETPKYTLYINLNIEDLMEKATWRLDGLHRILSLDSYVSREGVKKK